MTMHRYRRWLLMVVLVGCGGAPEPRAECPEPSPIALTIEATAHLNPDDSGRPLATELRLYQVKDERALEMASFEEVWQDGGAVLGDAMLSEETLTVFPGTQIDRMLRADPAAAGIIGVVIVRQPAGRTWRAVVPITHSEGGADRCPGPNPERFRLRLDGYRVEAIVPVSRRSTADDATS